MTPAQIVKEFARLNGMKVNTSGGIPMLSKQLNGGKWWIECFDNYGQAVAYFQKLKDDFEFGRIKTYPWSNGQ